MQFLWLSDSLIFFIYENMLLLFFFFFFFFNFFCWFLVISISRQFCENSREIVQVELIEYNASNLPTLPISA